MMTQAYMEVSSPSSASHRPSPSADASDNNTVTTDPNPQVQAFISESAIQFNPIIFCPNEETTHEDTKDLDLEGVFNVI
eukprot:scaffold87567_cov43-Attheya_sp.AAC.3